MTEIGAKAQPESTDAEELDAEDASLSAELVAVLASAKNSLANQQALKTLPAADQRRFLEGLGLMEPAAVNAPAALATTMKAIDEIAKPPSALASMRTSVTKH